MDDSEIERRLDRIEDELDIDGGTDTAERAGDAEHCHVVYDDTWLTIFEDEATGFYELRHDNIGDVDIPVTSSNDLYDAISEMVDDDETDKYVQFSSGGESYGCRVPVDADIDVQEHNGASDYEVHWHIPDDVSHMDHWTASGPYDVGAYADCDGIVDASGTELPDEAVSDYVDLPATEPVDSDEAMDYLAANNDFAGGVIESIKDDADLWVYAPESDPEAVDCPPGWAVSRVQDGGGGIGFAPDE